MEMKIFNLLKTMETEFNEASLDAEKFVINKNNSAGTRLRKAMQNIKGLAQDLRVEVQNQKNSVEV
jgi:hypothetical protein